MLSFDREGTLVSLEQTDRPDSLAGVEFYPGVLIPSMVNAHCHLELSYLKDSIPGKTGLTGFVREMARVRNGFTAEERVGAAAYRQARLWEEGTGAVGDICNDALLFEIKKTSPVRYFNFIELFGIDPGVAEAKWASGRGISDEAERAGLRHNLVPHSMYSVSEALMEKFRTLPAGLPVSLHFMESRQEAELFQGGGPFAESYRQNGLSVDFTRYGSPAGRLIASLPPDTPLLLVHNTFVTEEVIERLQGFFRNLTWVLCPRSNLYIEEAFPPVELLRRKGVKMAIGTDSLASNSSLSLLDELICLAGRTEAPLQELVGWATVHGANALGLSDSMGSFEPGKKCGAVLLSGMDWNRMTVTPATTARRIV